MANEIEFEITARLDKVESALKSVEDTSNKSAKNIESGFQGMQDKAASSFKAIGTAAVAAGAAIATYLTGAGIKNAIEKAVIQENAVNQLNNSLSLAGRYSREASVHFQEFAAGLQKTTTVGDETTLGLLAMATNFTKTNEEAEKLTKAAIDLSAATGKDLNTSLNALGRSLQGLPIAKVIPQLKDMTTEQLRLGGAIDFVSTRFAGAAAGQINTFGGAMKQLDNVFSDFEETIGNFIIKSPVVREVIKFISGEFLKLTESLSGIQNSGDLVGGLIQSTVKWGLVLNEFVVAPLELVWNLAQTVFAAIQTGIQTIVSVLAKTVEGFLQIAGVFTNRFKDAEKSVHEFTESSSAVLEDFANKTQDSFENSVNFDGTVATQNFLDQLNAVVTASATPLQTLKNNINGTASEITLTTASLFNAMWDQINAGATRTKLNVVDLAKTFQSGLMQTIVSSFSAIGTALVKGGNAFAAFAKAALGALGQVAIQIGTVLVAAGLGWSFIPGFQAASGAVVEGLALIVLGGALSALGGGAAGGGGVPATGASSSSSSTGSTTADIGQSTTSLQETQRQEPGTTLQVNIAGSVLGDKRTLGREIADALNEAFGSDGIKLASGIVV